MRKLINVFLAYVWLSFMIIAFSLGIGWTEVAVITSITAMIVFLILTMFMTNIRWYMTHEEMVKEQREAIRIQRNTLALIEKIKNKLFKENILTKEEVGEILDKE